MREVAAGSAVLVILLACEPTDDPAATADSTDSGFEDTALDSGGDSGPSGPSITILAPAEGTTWFLDTRYDIVVSVTGADSAGGTSTASVETTARAAVGTADLYGQPEASCPERRAELAQVRMNPLAIIAAGGRGVLYFARWYAANTLDAAWGESAQETGNLIMGESGLGYAVVHGEARGDLDVTVTSGPTQSEALTPGVEVVGEDRALVPSGGVIEETFAGWGAHVYRAPIVAD